MKDKFFENGHGFLDGDTGKSTIFKESKSAPKPPSWKQLNYIRDIRRRFGAPPFTGKTMDEARAYITKYKNGVPKSDFSDWVYRWYEGEVLNADYQNKYYRMPDYTKEDVLNSVIEYLGIDVESMQEVDYEALEDELKDSLLPDEKLFYGIYDESDYEYIEDLEDWDMDIPGWRDK